MWVSINHGDHGQTKVQRVSSSTKSRGGGGSIERKRSRRSKGNDLRETEIGGRSIDSIRIAEIILQLRMRNFRLLFLFN